VRKLIVLLVIVFIAMVALNRQRLFLRDPLGTVYRNSVPVDGAKVYINYYNDVLVEEPGARIWMVQNWNKVPGTPQSLNCMRAMACLTDADHATTTPLGGASYQPGTQMNDREVSFNDGYGIGVRVTLR
jgi:hypothetical protein